MASSVSIKVMKTINLTLLLLASSICNVGLPALAATIQGIEQLPFDEAYRLWLQEKETILQRSASHPSSFTIPGGSMDAKTGRFMPSSYQALTCRLGRDAHIHESFLVSALSTNDWVSMILDASLPLCSRYGVESQATVLFDPKHGYTNIMRGYILGADGQRRIWLKAMAKPISQPSGPANGSQPIRTETNQTSSAAGSRR